MDKYKPGDHDPAKRHRVYILGLDLAVILRALYNRARPKFRGRAITPTDVSLEETRELLRQPRSSLGVGYWKDRAIKAMWDEDHTWINLEVFHEYNGAEEGFYAIEEVIHGHDRVVWTMTIVPK